MERNLSEDQQEIVINCGALGYCAEKISTLIKVEVSEVKTGLKNPKSELFKLYRKGKVIGDYVIDLKLFELAKQGDLKALEEFEERKLNR